METEKRKPTHVLRVEVPLHLDERPAEVDFDVVRDAVLTVLSLSRAVYLKALCDDTQVSMIEWPIAKEALYDEADDLRRAALWVVDNWDSQATQHLSMKALRSAVGAVLPMSERAADWNDDCKCENPDRGLFIWRGDPGWASCVQCDGRVRPLTDAEKAQHAARNAR